MAIRITCINKAGGPIRSSAAGQNIRSKSKMAALLKGGHFPVTTL
jgi:hypothetical protein